jgi:hypothetical protein
MSTDKPVLPLNPEIVETLKETFNDTKNPDSLVNKVNRFMNANYPCHCKDKECPGNIFESLELISIFTKALSTERQ